MYSSCNTLKPGTRYTRFGRITGYLVTTLLLIGANGYSQDTIHLLGDTSSILCYISEVNDSMIIYTSYGDKFGKHSTIETSKISGFYFLNSRDAAGKIKTTRYNASKKSMNKELFFYPPSDNFLQLTHKKRGRQKKIKVGQKVLIESNKYDQAWRARLVAIQKDTITVLLRSGRRRSELKLAINKLYFIGAKHPLKVVLHFLLMSDAIYLFNIDTYKRYFMEIWDIQAIVY